MDLKPRLGRSSLPALYSGVWGNALSLRESLQSSEQPSNWQLSLVPRRACLPQKCYQANLRASTEDPTPHSLSSLQSSLHFPLQPHHPSSLPSTSHSNKTSYTHHPLYSYQKRPQSICTLFTLFIYLLFTCVLCVCVCVFSPAPGIPILHVFFFQSGFKCQFCHLWTLWLPSVYLTSECLWISTHLF